jgi:hypothetical protein
VCRGGCGRCSSLTRLTKYTAGLLDGRVRIWSVERKIIIQNSNDFLWRALGYSLHKCYLRGTSSVVLGYTLHYFLVSRPISPKVYFPYSRVVLGRALIPLLKCIFFCKVSFARDERRPYTLQWDPKVSFLLRMGSGAY